MFNIHEADDENAADKNEAENVEEADESEDWNEEWPSPPGWEWNPNKKQWDKTITGRFQDLDDEERYKFARQKEAQEINFDDSPGAGRVLMYTINVRETVQLASINHTRESKYLDWRS